MFDFLYFYGFIDLNGFHAHFVGLKPTMLDILYAEA